jgi:hypothetical protein
MTAAPLAIFAMPKPFAGPVGVIQRNAILSWTQLSPRPAIFLFGEEAGTAEIAAELRLGHLRDIQRNALGTPLLSDLLRRAREVTSSRLLCYINCDIILLQAFVDAVAQIQKKFPRFLAVAHRWEIELTEPLAMEADAPLHLGMLPAGAPGHHTAIDVFAFTREMYAEVPALALGRAWFDQWLIKDALLRHIPVVDITRVARAIHQKHDYAHIAGGQRGAYGGDEAQQNLEIYGGVKHAYTLLDATHELLPGGAIRRVRARRGKFQVKQWLWRIFVLRTAPLRKRLGWSRSANP